MRRVLTVTLTAVPLAAGWLLGTLYKITVLVQAAFIEGFEVGRRM